MKAFVIFIIGKGSGCSGEGDGQDIERGKPRSSEDVSSGRERVEPRCTDLSVFGERLFVPAVYHKYKDRNRSVHTSLDVEMLLLLGEALIWDC